MQPWVGGGDVWLRWFGLGLSNTFAAVLMALEPFNGQLYAALSPPAKFGASTGLRGTWR